MKDQKSLSALKKFIVVGTASVLCSTMLALPSASATPGSDFTTAYSATTGTLLTESLWMGIVNNVASLMDKADAIFTSGDKLKVPASTETCDGTIAGAIRYEGGAAEICNGTGWTAMGGGAVADEAPIAFSFADQTMVATNTTITSNAVIVSGFDGPLTAYCSTNCTAVKRNDGSWDTSASGFMPGDTITIQLTSNATPGATKVALVNLGDTTSASWTVTSDPFVCGTDTATGRSPDVLTYPTVVGEDGRCWLAKNLGATNVATAYNDATSYGWLYQYGRKTDGHQSRTSLTQAGPVTVASAPADYHITGTNWASDDSDGSIRETNWGLNGSSNPCPSSFRPATNPEWANWVTNAMASGDANYLVRAFNSSLKLTAAGYRHMNGTGPFNEGVIGYYIESTKTSIAMTLDSGNINANAGYAMNESAIGISMRCIKD